MYVYICIHMYIWFCTTSGIGTIDAAMRTNLVRHDRDTRPCSPTEVKIFIVLFGIEP